MDVQLFRPLDDRLALFGGAACAISAQKTRLFIINTSNSDTLLTTKRLKFLWSLQRWRSAALVPYPTEGIRYCPLNRRRTRESIPLGFLHEASTRSNRSDWWRMNRLLRLRTIFFVETD